MNIHLLNFGFNYAGTPYELAGCEPDARRFNRRLSPYCASSTLVTEMGTKRRPCENVDDMLSISRKVRHRLDEGDLMVITQSSHGTWEKTSDTSESSGGNQGIVAPDFSVLWDDRLAAECADRAKGSFIFSIIDCCHPGSIQRGGLACCGRKRGIPLDRCKATRHVPTGLQMRALTGCWGFHGAGDGPTDYCFDGVFYGFPFGAMSHYTLTALDQLKRGATYRDWFRLIAGKRPKGFLPSDLYDQSPVLVGSRVNVCRPVPFI